MADPWMQFARWPRGVFQSGPEGNWSTFPLSAGIPNQDFNVLVSTNTPYLSLPFSDYCVRNPIPRCGSRRGALPFLGQPSDGFAISQSSSWIAANKTDRVGMGWGANVTSRLRVEVAKPDKQFMGMVGLRALASPGLSWLGTAYMNQMDSLLQTALANKLASLSFAYTAGAAYRNADASLVFGGYDAFRVGPSAHSFPFSSDLDRPLMARLATITLVNGPNSPAPEPLLHSATPVLLDSTSPYFELPEAICKEFERAFDLELEPESGKFRVNESTRQQLYERNTKVRFKLTEEYEADGSVELELPYASFDLQIGSALDDRDRVTYFPIKTTTVNQPSVLGRTFFQEVYLIVDYERINFTLAQCAFPPPGAVLPNATIINWYRGTEAGPGLTLLLALSILFTVLVIIWVVSRLPKILIHYLLEAPRARRLQQKEQQLERLWKEIHTSKPQQEFSMDLSRTNGSSQAPDTTFNPYVDDPTSDEESLSSPQAIAKAKAGKKRATPLQILR